METVKAEKTSRIDVATGLASFPCMTKSEAKRGSRLNTAVIIVGSSVALIVGAFVISNLNSYIVMDRGKVSVPRLLKEREVHTSDLPALVEALSRGSEDVRYAALIFSAPDRPSEQDQ